jgi:hypothetical protein
MFTKHLIAFLILLALLIPASSVWAAETGSVGFSFLKISWGARNAAMGDAGVALSWSGIYGAYFNPSLLEEIELPAVGFMHHEYIFDTRREFIAGAVPLFDGGLALGIDFFSVSDLEARQSPTSEPDGLFDAQNVLWFAGYGRQIADRVSVGLLGKYAYEKIETESAAAINFDVGGLVELGEGISGGLAVRNVGEKPRFIREEIDLPLTVAVGAVWQSDKMSFAADLSFPKEGETRINLGGESWLADFLAVRAGYKFGYDEEDLAFGFGFAKGMWKIDYAFVPYNSGLGNSHRFALTMNWR